MARAFLNLGGSPGSKPIQINSYTTAGGHTFTVPADCSHIEVWGTAGGGGGGTPSNNWNNAGGGRAGASFYMKVPATALSSATYSLTVGGYGHNATGSNNQGGSGGYSQMFGIRASGGPGGAASQGGPGNGNEFVTAQVENSADCPIPTSEVMLITGGQCSMGSGGNSDDDPSTYGNGASSIWGSGGAGGARSANSGQRNGQNGHAYGSGGGGGANRNGSDGGAGNGADGIVLIISYGA